MAVEKDQIIASLLASNNYPLIRGYIDAFNRLEWESIRNLRNDLLSGDGVKKNELLAAKITIFLAMNGDCDSQAKISKFYSEGAFFQGNATETFIWKAISNNLFPGISAEIITENKMVQKELIQRQYVISKNSLMKFREKKANLNDYKKGALSQVITGKWSGPNGLEIHFGQDHVKYSFPNGEAKELKFTVFYENLEDGQIKFSFPDLLGTTLSFEDLYDSIVFGPGNTTGIYLGIRLGFCEKKYPIKRID